MLAPEWCTCMQHMIHVGVEALNIGMTLRCEKHLGHNSFWHHKYQKGHVSGSLGRRLDKSCFSTVESHLIQHVGLTITSLTWKGCIQYAVLVTEIHHVIQGLHDLTIAYLGDGAAE